MFDSRTLGCEVNKKGTSSSPCPQLIHVVVMGPLHVSPASNLWRGGGEKKKERNTLIGLNREYVKSVGQKSIINQDICKKNKQNFHVLYIIYCQGRCHVRASVKLKQQILEASRNDKSSTKPVLSNSSVKPIHKLTEKGKNPHASNIKKKAYDSAIPYLVFLLQSGEQHRLLHAQVPVNHAQWQYNRLELGDHIFKSCTGTTTRM